MKKFANYLLTLSLLAAALSAKAQNKVSGQVTDETGQTLPGVTVQIKDTNKGTITDIDGQYTLQLDQGDAILVYSFVGFVTQEIKVGSRNRIDVTLQDDVTALDEVVVVGYGTQKKVNLTGAVGSVTVDETLVSRSTDNNLSTALSGLVPGLSVRQGSGMPGQSDTEILVRGLGTVNNANPLVVVDGLPDVDINTININDVESVSVLKDAASAAVYGSRAANGVILITTKSGREGKSKVSYSGNYTITEPISFYDNIDSYPTTMALHIQGANAGNKESLYKWGAIEEWMAKGMLDPIRYPNTNWYDVIFQNGKVQNHNISASGGSDKFKFFISGGITDQEGVVIRNFYKRYNFRTNLEYKVKNSITVGTRFQGSWAESEYGLTDGIGGGIRNTNPGVTPIDPETGRFGGAMAYGENKQASNLLAEYSLGHNESRTMDVNGNMYGIWKPFTGFSTRVDFGVMYENGFERDWDNPASSYNLQTGEVVSVLVGDNAGIDNSMEINYKTNLQIRTNYQKELFQGHNLGLMLGYNEEYWNDRELSAGRMDRLYPNIIEIDPSLPTTQSTGGSSSEEGLRSVIGRVNYSIMDRYLFEFTARYDGSSKFSEGNRYGFFPSVSAGWKFSEERFFGGLKDVIYFGKLRASWGALGNNSGVGRYEQKETFETTNYILNNGIVQGFSYSKIIDPTFSWESTQVFNVGLDVGLLNGLIIAEFDYYDRLTTGMIRPSDLSDFLFGYQPPRVNVGELRNRGVETTVNYEKRIGDLRIGAKLNFSYNLNRLEQWNEFLSPGNVFLEMPYQFVYGYESVGLAQSWTEVYNNAFQDNYASPGDVLIKDINGDGTIGGEDKIAYPSKMQRRPTTNASLGGNLGWKGFDFSFFINATAGRYDFWGDNLTTTSPRDNRFNFSHFHESETWNYQNKDGTMPRLTISAGDDGGRNGTESSLWLQNRSFIRLRNIQLGYTLPSNVTNAISLSRVRFYATVDNLVTLTQWQGVDPEKDTSGDDFYPLLKSYAFGVNIDF